MQVQFQNVLFGLDSYKFAVVDETVLTIVLENNEIRLHYESEQEAFDAQAELGELINEVKSNTTSFGDIFQEAAGVVNSIFGDVFQKAKTKVTNVSKTVKNAKTPTQSFEERVQAVVDELSKVIETAQPTVEAAIKRTSSTLANEAQEVFGTKRAAPSEDKEEVVISDLSDNALRVAISQKVDHLIETDVRVKALLANLRHFHSDEEIEDVIESYKAQIFDIARDNETSTVSEIITQLLRSL